MSAKTDQWPVARLGDICDFKYGKSLPEAARSGGAVPVYGSNGVVGGHDAALTASETIIIGRKGSHGEVNFSSTPCWPIDTTYYVDCTATNADLHWLRYRLAGAGLNQMNRAAAIPGLNREDAYRVEILLPPLPEQRRIAAILDQAETLRTQRRAALAQLDSLTQSLFLDMFGDPVVNTKAWATQSIASLGKVVTGNTPSRESPEYYGNAVEWIKSDNVNTPHYYLTKATESLSVAGKAVGRVVPPKSILVTCIAGSPDCIGNAAMTDREVAFNQQINAFVPTEIDPHFAYAHISIGKKLVQSASTNGMKGMVSKSRFEAIELMTPPLPLQQTFATRIQAIEALKATHRAALAQLDALFASLQQRAFAGEL